MIGDGVFSIFSLVTETYRRVSHMARWGLKFYFSSVLRVSVSWEDVIFFYPSEELSCWHNHRFFRSGDGGSRELDCLFPPAN